MNGASSDEITFSHGDSRQPSSPSSGRAARETCFTLPEYPEELRKKVTLLGYFRDHLVGVTTTCITTRLFDVIDLL